MIIADTAGMLLLLLTVAGRYAAGIRSMVHLIGGAISSRLSTSPSFARLTL